MLKYPFLLTPVYKDYIWGGVKLREKWGKASNSDVVAESWELSLHPDALSRIANGALHGRNLIEVLEAHPDFAGKKCLSFPHFPMLIKLIDAAQNLSVQVHPSDRYALEKEKSYGKSEVWFILEAESGAGIYFGFKKDTDRTEVAERISQNTLTDILNFIPVAPGDVYMIEAGTVHAIGKGITLAEIQQNSNLTYRVYDFGRTGADGKPRELHIQKALDVMNFAACKAEKSDFPFVDYAAFKKRLVADNKYFFSEYYLLDSVCQLYKENCFISLTLTSGSAVIKYGDGEKLSVSKGDTVFIPAGLEVAVEGSAEFITSALR
ncbi:MAG: class I mannose-6-phosphate isomerase [Clostridiales bacterium]|jgi:mannose-6-phosphate isomerase|nr:class I mannose-6-phosphate isomerase [Clostridiales bacterium]